MNEHQMDQIYKQTKLEYFKKRRPVFFKIRRFVRLVATFLILTNIATMYLMTKGVNIYTFIAFAVTIIADYLWWVNPVYNAYQRMMKKECDRIFETTKRRIENKE